MTYQIRSNKGTTRSKRWVDGDLMEGDLCSFLLEKTERKLEKERR